MSLFEQLEVAEQLSGNHVYRTAKASMVQEAAQRERWDYAAEVSIRAGDQTLFGGRCIRARLVPENGVEIEFHDFSWDFDQQVIGPLCMFGMSQQEMAYWLPRLAGAPKVHLPGFIPSDQLRPFMYAVPLIGLKPQRKMHSLLVNDLGVAAGQADTTFYPLAKKLGLHRRDPVWRRSNPKAFGVVMARDLFQAEKLALQRAGVTADLITFALRCGVSHWEDRYQSDMLEWHAEAAQARVRLSNWILIREVQEVKGWARTLDWPEFDQQANWENSSNRISKFMEKFLTASIVGDIASQVDRRPLSETEGKLIAGVQRALHWYGIASSESDILDRFLAEWIALESILDCIKYPPVFRGSRQPTRRFLEKSITEAPYPSDADPLLSISPEMLQRRVLMGDWPLPRKLEIFAKCFGLPLQDGDVAQVRELGRLRGQVLHGGKHDNEITGSQLRRLEYLVERLIIGTSICVYRELEDDQTHLIETIGLASGEMGAARAFLDGREVPYECRLSKTELGSWWPEYLIEGRIYDQDNARFEYQQPEQAGNESRR